MTHEEMLHFVTWHFEVGSALDTRVQLLGSGEIDWEGWLVGPRFKVKAKLNVRLEGREAVGVAHMKAAEGSHIFDMVLGCRLLCPPGRLSRPLLPDVIHAGTGSYLDLPQGECVVGWGEHGSQYSALCATQTKPNGFSWAPYIADEPDGWRLHARVLSTGGPGLRRFWLFGHDILNLPIPHGEQDVKTEINAHSHFYRIFRFSDYRERTVQDSMTFDASIRVVLPDGIVP